VKLVNRKFLGLAGALVLATVGTIAIVAYVHGADARARERQTRVEVLVVTKPVPPGTPASQLGDRVSSQSVVREDEVDGAVTNVHDLAGRVTNSALVPGEQVIRSRFVDASAYLATGSSVQVPAGLLQTTLKLDPERALGGLLTPGTHVGVTASFDDKDARPAESHMIRNDVLVTNVQITASSSSNSSSGITATSASSDAKPGSAPTGQVYVTLALDAASVEQVVFAAERGSLWLSQQPDGAKTGLTQIITRDNALR